MFCYVVLYPWPPHSIDHTCFLSFIHPLHLLKTCFKTPLIRTPQHTNIWPPSSTSTSTATATTTRSSPRTPEHHHLSSFLTTSLIAALQSLSGIWNPLMNSHLLILPPLSMHARLSPPSSHLSIYLSIYPSIHLSIHLSIHPSIYPSIYLSIHLSIYLSIHPSIYLSIHLSIHLSIYARTLTKRPRAKASPKVPDPIFFHITVFGIFFTLLYFLESVRKYAAEGNGRKEGGGFFPLSCLCAAVKGQKGVQG